MEESWGGIKAVCEAHLRRWRRACVVTFDRACHCCLHFRVDLIRSQTRRSLVECWHYSKTDHCAAVVVVVVVVGRVIVVVVLSTTSVLLYAERRAPCIGPQTANLQTHTHKTVSTLSKKIAMLQHFFFNNDNWENSLRTSWRRWSFSLWASNKLLLSTNNPFSESVVTRVFLILFCLKMFHNVGKASLFPTRAHEETAFAVHLNFWRYFL